MGEIGAGFLHLPDGGKPFLGARTYNRKSVYKLAYAFIAHEAEILKKLAKGRRSESRLAPPSRGVGYAISIIPERSFLLNHGHKGGKLVCPE